MTQAISDTSTDNGLLFRWIAGAHSALDKVGKFSRWLNAAGLGIFFIMMCLTFVDVILRYVFSRPIMGVKEYTEVMLVLLIAFTIAYTYEKKGHVTINLVTDKLADRAKLILATIVTIIGIALFVIVFWRCAAELLFFIDQDKQHGTAMYIPAAPFQAAMVLGTLVLLLLIVRDFLGYILDGIKLHLKYYHWLIIFGIPICFFILCIFWVQPKLWPLGLPLVGLIGVIFMLLLMFMGMPTAFALLLAGILMIAHIRGTTTAFDVVGVEIFSTASDYTWSVVCFFVLMGYLCLFARFGEDIYTTFYRWIGHLRGGLSMATIVASTAMAGIVGDALSVVTTMGTISYPQMKKYGYDDHLSTGTIAAGATIGPLIPPSMGFIIYGVLTGQSIGVLFIAGIIPGLLLASLFIINIVIRCRINPQLGPRGPSSSWPDRMASLKYGGPIVVLFLFIIGGIYAGIFTASEGGAMGCVGALVIGLAMRRFNRNNFIETLIGAGKVIGMILLIIIGSIIFSRFVAWCNLSGVVMGLISGMHLSPQVYALFILLIFFVLGFFIDILPMLLILVPIFHPVAVAMGLNPIWFTVLVTMTIQIGVITPPFATLLFALQGVLPKVPINVIFKGIFPFVLSNVICLVILFLIPELVTWLPGLLR